MAKTQTPKLQPELTEPQIVALRKLREADSRSSAFTAGYMGLRVGTLRALESRGLAQSDRWLSDLFSDRESLAWQITESGLQYLEALDSQETASRMAALESDLAQLQPALEAQRDLAPGDVDQTLIDHAAELDQELQELREPQIKALRSLMEADPYTIRMSVGLFQLYWAPSVGDVAIQGARAVILDESQLELIRLRGQLAHRYPPIMQVIDRETGRELGSVSHQNSVWITIWDGKSGFHDTWVKAHHEMARRFPPRSVFLVGLQPLQSTQPEPEPTAIQPEPMVAIPMDVVEAVRTCLGYTHRPDLYGEDYQMAPWESRLMESVDKVEEWLRTIQTEETKND